MSVPEVFARYEAALDGLIQSVDTLSENRKAEGNFMGKWIRDDDIHAAVTNIKNTGDALSQSCTRLSMLALGTVSADAAESLLGEIVSAAGAYFTCFEYFPQFID